MALTEIYYNLHRHCFSVRTDGIVQIHATTVILEDVTFKVYESGRQRVLAEQRKNVHAYARGTVVFTDRHWEHMHEDADAMVTYNPYKYASFVMANTLAPIFTAKKVLLSGRQIYILIP